MLNKTAVILSLLTIHCMISIASTGKIKDKLEKVKNKAEGTAKKGIGAIGSHLPIGGQKEKEEKISKAPKLSPDQIEFSKKFFKNLNDDQQKGEKGIPLNYTKPLKTPKGTKINEKFNVDVPEDGKESLDNEPGNNGEPQAAPQSQPAPGGIGTYRSVPSGGTMFMDGLSSNFMPIGDAYSGMPDSLISMGKWCIEIIIKGALFLVYTTIRWPHKILLKVIIITAIITWVPNLFMWCLNPVAIARIVGKSKIVNNNFDDLADLQYKLKVRLANMIDKVYNLREVQKLSCCMYQEWRDGSVRAVDDDAKEFLMHYFHSFAKLIQIVYCGDYNDGTDQCEGVEYDEAEPIRVIPRSHITLWAELFTKFF